MEIREYSAEEFADLVDTYAEELRMLAIASRAHGKFFNIRHGTEAAKYIGRQIVRIDEVMNENQ